jgi:hypothetical protein
MEAHLHTDEFIMALNAFINEKPALVHLSLPFSPGSERIRLYGKI